MKVAYIHNVEIEIDSRAQKEVNTLIKDGHQVLFCGWNKEKTTKLETKKVFVRGKSIQINNICHKVKKRKGLKENIIPLLCYEIRLLLWLLKNHKKYDIIHGCSFDVILVSYFIARLFRKKIVYDIYDDYADSHVAGAGLYKLIRKWDAYFIKHVDVVIICSEKRLEQIASKNAKKIEVIHNTPDIEEVDFKLLEIPYSSRLKIVYVGNLNGGRFVYEIAELVSKVPQWEFHCGGSGLFEDDIKKLGEEHENIVFYGRLTYEQTLALESQCDIIPAIYDPSVKNHKYAAPNKFYEALYLGKPTIMIHNTGMDDLVDEYNVGITTEFDIDKIFGAVQCIDQKREYWKQREMAIKNVYHKYFSWNIMEKRLQEIYKTL